MAVLVSGNLQRFCHSPAHMSSSCRSALGHTHTHTHTHRHSPTHTHMSPPCVSARRHTHTHTHTHRHSLTHKHVHSYLHTLHNQTQLCTTHKSVYAVRKQIYF